MKLLRNMMTASLLVCPSLVWANFPFDVGTLGHMRAVLEICSKTSPQKATTYLLQIKSLIGDASKSEVAKASRTEEYQRAYQSTRSKFSTLTQEGIVHACADYFATEK